MCVCASDEEMKIGELCLQEQKAFSCVSNRRDDETTLSNRIKQCGATTTVLMYDRDPDVPLPYPHGHASQHAK